MRPAIHKGVPPLFNNIRNLYADKEKVIIQSDVFHLFCASVCLSCPERKLSLSFP